MSSLGMIIKSIKGVGDSLGQGLPSPTAINPDSHPLSSFETKMAAQNGKQSILTILRKNGRLWTGLLLY